MSGRKLPHGLRRSVRHLLDLLRRPFYPWVARRVRTTAAGRRPRVLVGMEGAIGNCVEATPLVQAIRAHWPNAEITIVTPPIDLFDDWCLPQRTVTEIASLEGTTFDYTFVTWDSSITASPRLFRPGRLASARSLTGARCMKPEREYNMMPLRRLGYRGPTPPLYVSLRRPSPPLEGSPRIAIVPGGNPEPAWRRKRWPRYPALIESLLDEYAAARISIIGTENDDLEGRLPTDERLIDLRGRLTLREAAGLLAEVDIAVGNDCGPMHIADAVGTPVVVLFGPTCEVKNGPRNVGIVLATDASCRPCQGTRALRECPDGRCMTGITVEEVTAAVTRLLGS